MVCRDSLLYSSCITAASPSLPMPYVVSCVAYRLGLFSLSCSICLISISKSYPPVLFLPSPCLFSLHEKAHCPALQCAYSINPRGNINISNPICLHFCHVLIIPRKIASVNFIFFSPINFILFIAHQRRTTQCLCGLSRLSCFSTALSLCNDMLSLSCPVPDCRSNASV